MTNEVTVLKKARRLLSDPKRWAKNAYRRDGTEVLLDDAGFRQAALPLRSDTCFCALGAVMRYAGPEVFDIVEAYLMAAVPPKHDVCTYNDTPSRTHGEVMAMFDKAVGLAEADL